MEDEMTRKKYHGRFVPLAVLLGLTLFAGPAAPGQEKPKREVIQATAKGNVRASGSMVGITITIESYSTPEDQKTLMDAFKGGGHDALVKALSKMKSRGRVAVTGTLGYQIAYIRSFPTEDGRMIRLITDRPIQAGEALVGGRTKDYDLSGMQLNLSKDKKKSDGYLAVAGKFIIDKNQQITFESLGSAWQLVNIQER